MMTQTEASPAVCSADPQGEIAAVAGDLIDILGACPRVGRCSSQGIAEWVVYNSQQAPMVSVTVWPDDEAEAQAEAVARAISRSCYMIGELLEAVDSRDVKVAELQKKQSDLLKQHAEDTGKIGRLIIRLVVLEKGLQEACQQANFPALYDELMAEADRIAGVTNESLTADDTSAPENPASPAAGPSPSGCGQGAAAGPRHLRPRTPAA